MRSALKLCVVGLFLVMLGGSQQSAVERQAAPQQNSSPSRGGGGVRGPGGGPTPSKDTILQWDHEQNLEDTSRLVKLAQELKWDLANNDRQVLEISTVKKMDEIDRLIHKIRARVAKR